MKKWNSVCCVTALVCSLFLQGCVKGAKAEVNLTPILENSPSSFLCIKDNALGVFSAETKEFTSLKRYTSAKTITFRGFVSDEEQPVFCLEIRNNSVLGDAFYTEVWCYNKRKKTLEKIVTLSEKDLQLIDSVDGGYNLTFLSPNESKYRWYSGFDKKLHYPKEYNIGKVKESYFTSLPNIVIVSEPVADKRILGSLIQRGVYAFRRIDLSSKEEPTLIGHGYKCEMQNHGSVFFYEQKFNVVSYDINEASFRDYPFPTNNIEWGMLSKDSIFVTVLDECEDVTRIYQVKPSVGLRLIPMDSNDKIDSVESLQGDLYIKKRTGDMTKLVRIVLSSLPTENIDENEIEKQVLYEVPTNTIFRSRFIMPNTECTLRHSELLKSGIYRFIAITKNAKPVVYDFEEEFDIDDYYPNTIMEQDLPDNGTAIRLLDVDNEYDFPEIETQPVLYLYNDIKGNFTRIDPPGGIKGDYIIPITPRTISNSGNYAIVSTRAFEKFMGSKSKYVEENEIYLYDLNGKEPPYCLGLGVEYDQILDLEDFLTYTNKTDPWTLLFWLD